MILHHIGIIVKDLKKSISIYMNMGYVIDGDIINDSIQKNWVVILKSDFSPRIELIEPIDRASSIVNFNLGYHHICYEAEAGEDIVSKFKEMNIGRIFTSPIIAPALGDREVVFACLQNGTFVEFIV